MTDRKLAPAVRDPLAVMGPHNATQGVAAPRTARHVRTADRREVIVPLPVVLHRRANASIAAAPTLSAPSAPRVPQAGRPVAEVTARQAARRRGGRSQVRTAREATDRQAIVLEGIARRSTAGRVRSKGGTSGKNPAARPGTAIGRGLRSARRGTTPARPTAIALRGRIVLPMVIVRRGRIVLPMVIGRRGRIVPPMVVVPPSPIGLLIETVRIGLPMVIAHSGRIGRPMVSVRRGRIVRHVPIAPTGPTGELAVLPTTEIHSRASGTNTGPGRAPGLRGPRPTSEAIRAGVSRRTPGRGLPSR